MKNIGILALVTFAVCTASAFFFSGAIYPRSLPDAYKIAVQTIGSRTNELVCIEGKRKDHGVWNFVFEGTNASRVVVFVSDISTNGWIDVAHK